MQLEPIGNNSSAQTSFNPFSTPERSAVSTAAQAALAVPNPIYDQLNTLLREMNAGSQYDVLIAKVNAIAVQSLVTIYPEDLMQLGLRDKLNQIIFHIGNSALWLYPYLKSISEGKDAFCLPSRANLELELSKPNFYIQDYQCNDRISSIFEIFSFMDKMKSLLQNNVVLNSEVFNVTAPDKPTLDDTFRTFIFCLFLPPEYHARKLLECKTGSLWNFTENYMPNFRYQYLIKDWMSNFNFIDVDLYKLGVLLLHPPKEFTSKDIATLSKISDMAHFSRDANKLNRLLAIHEEWMKLDPEKYPFKCNAWHEILIFALILRTRVLPAYLREKWYRSLQTQLDTQRISCSLKNTNEVLYALKSVNGLLDQADFLRRLTASLE